MLEPRDEEEEPRTKELHSHTSTKERVIFRTRDIARVQLILTINLGGYYLRLLCEICLRQCLLWSQSPRSFGLLHSGPLVLFRRLLLTVCHLDDTGTSLEFDPATLHFYMSGQSVCISSQKFPLRYNFNLLQQFVYK